MAGSRTRASALSPNAIRHDSGLRSARGSRITATANPAPAARLRIDTAQARAPSGASSMTAMPPITRAEFTAARRNNWEPVKIAKFGESPETAFARQTTATDQRITLRRPMRSEAIAAMRAKSTPSRVIASAVPSPASETPNESAIALAFCPKSAAPKAANPAASEVVARKLIWCSLNSAGADSGERFNSEGAAWPESEAVMQTTECFSPRRSTHLWTGSKAQPKKGISKG